MSQLVLVLSKQRTNLLRGGSSGEHQLRVGGPEHPELGAALLQRLERDGGRVRRGARPRYVQHFQVPAVGLGAKHFNDRVNYRLSHSVINFYSRP